MKELMQIYFSKFDGQWLLDVGLGTIVQACRVFNHHRTSLNRFSQVCTWDASVKGSGLNTKHISNVTICSYLSMGRKILQWSISTTYVIIELGYITSLYNPYSLSSFIHLLIAIGGTWLNSETKTGLSKLAKPSNIRFSTWWPGIRGLK